MQDDSIDGIYATLEDCAKISKYAGGIGLNVHNIRGRNSIIRGTNGTSTGLIPMLRVYNATARYVNQCFVPETIVYTCMGPMQIKDVQVGEYVISSNGLYNMVLETHTNFINDTILSLQTNMSVEPILVTKTHQVYVYNILSERRYYKNADDINIAEELVGFPKEMDFNDAYDDELDMSEDLVELYKFLGLIFVHGRLSPDDKFRLTLTNQNAIDFAKQFLSKQTSSYSIYRGRYTPHTTLSWYITDTPSIERLCFHPERWIGSMSKWVCVNFLLGATMNNTLSINRLVGAYCARTRSKTKMFLLKYLAVIKLGLICTVSNETICLD